MNALKMTGFKKGTKAMKIIVKFEGIDSWNRAIFKNVEKQCFYGSTNKLFSYDDPINKIKKKIKSNDLYYFGNSFDCEPMGLKCDVKISWN